MLRLAYSYMRYYKSQTAAILASIILTAALLSGVSSLMYSNQLNSLENNKKLYGDWHYSMPLDTETAKAFLSGDEISETSDSDFQIEQYGMLTIEDTVAAPYPVSFVQADEAYREMAHRRIIEGRYPQGSAEIAADRYTLWNLGSSGIPGDSLSIDGKDYILTGILESTWTSGTDDMQLFVSGSFAGRESYTLIYLQFNENKKLYKQLDAFQKKYRIPSDSIERNDEVIQYLSGERPDSIYDILKFGLTHEDGNFTYVILKLQSEYNLAFNGMLLLLCRFSIFIIHSIFRISVSRRTSEYAVMETLGISSTRIGGTLILELWLLFLPGYFIGCLLGNGILKLAYQQLNHVFSAGGTGAGDSVTMLSEIDQISADAAGAASGFHIAWDAMLAGFIFLLAALVIVGFSTVHSMRRRSVRQIMNGDASYTRGKRRIYSFRNPDLANVIVRKFMFSSKRRVLGILLSLSLGGCMFLCTTYMIENLKIHAEMALKSDDGLGSDYRISVKSASLSDTIPAQTANEIQNMPELSEVHAVRYTLGEVTIQEQELEWDEYFDEPNSSGYFERFGGICVPKENGTYGIKYDVYGYDENLLEQLQEFLLEGEIHPDELEQGNQIIASANQDGQGNYNFYGKHPGDTITLRVPKNPACPPEILKFQSSGDEYITKEFKIAAIVSRSLAQETDFLNAGPWRNSQSLIMTNQQFYHQFGAADYSFINASAADGTDTNAVCSMLLQKIQDVPKAVLQDYTTAIETQKGYLRQQQLFFSGIAVILLIISLFHIINSMNYSILSHRREYGIIRAMGITDIGFYKMVLRMGILYGLLADLFILLLYGRFLRQIMNYYMAHVVQFLHYTAAVPIGIMAGIMILNILIAAIAVLIPARKIIKSQIISEIS